MSSQYRRSLYTAAAALALLLVSNARAGAGYLRSASSCNGNQVVVDWTFYEDANNPSGHPEWVGYDVLRRENGTCGPQERANAQIIPRAVGETQSLSFTDTPPSSASYHYRVVMVDADHHEINDYFLCDMCPRDSWVSCPTGPPLVTEGTIEDFGWAFFVFPCNNSCFMSFYTEPIEALRSHTGTGEAYRFYGTGYCGTIEGCGMSVERYEPATCAPTPARVSTWGHLKVIYR